MTSIGDRPGKHQPRELPHPLDIEGLLLPDAARMYAQAGLRILPLRPGSKEPMGRLVPHGVHDASCDVETVTSWWDEVPEANIGLATGEGSFTVVDADVRADGNGVEVVESMIRSGQWPAPAHVIATPSGGRHYYYQGRRSVGNKSLRRLRVDLRGQGGYVLVPPSMVDSPSGIGLYDEDFQRRTGQPERLPWDRLEKRHRAERRRHRALVRSRRRNSGRKPALVRYVRGLEPGTRNNGLFWAVCRALEQGRDTTSLIDAALDIGLSEAEVARTLRSAYREVFGDDPERG